MLESSFFVYLRKFFSYKYSLLVLWLILGFFITHARVSQNSINNYLIFKYTFFHALQHQNLYLEYPGSYYDTNHYGPLFSLVMAPFAMLPQVLQIYLWQACNIFLLFFSIHQLPLSIFRKNMICLICTQELYLSLAEFQTNGAIASLIILSWIFINNKKDFWAAFGILAGFYIKIYSIIGLAFFFFSEQKWKFILSLAFWAIVLFVLPMPFFGAEYVVHSYGDWFNSLANKNAVNAVSIYQDISVPGMFRRLSGYREMSSLPFLAAGVLLFLLPFSKPGSFGKRSFRFLMLSSALIFIVLFSSGSESVTYIIAFAGVGIWFVSLPSPLKKADISIFIFALYFGSLFMTDLFPPYIKSHYIKPFALKAFPCLIVWLTIIYKMIITKHKSEPLTSLKIAAKANT